MTQAPSKRAKKVKVERRRRKGLGSEAGLKLAVPKDKLDPKYRYRWAKGDPARIAQLTQADDYDIVTDSELAEGEQQTGIGVNPQRFGGKDEHGKPFNMVLLRKSKELYEEDGAEKQKTVADRENTLRRGVVQAPDGKTGLSGSHAYVPQGGIIIKQGE